MKILTLDQYVNSIENLKMKAGVKKIIKEHRKVINELPASISGKYHAGETLEDHIRETAYFTELTSDEFRLTADLRDTLMAAAILHDIGNCTISKKGEYKHYQYYEKTGWSRKSGEDYAIHPILSAQVIGMNPFPGSAEVQVLVMTHMSHWSEKTCPKPEMLNATLAALNRFLCMADYLASRSEVKIDV